MTRLMDDVRDYLIAHGADIGWGPITEGFLPNDSDKAICLYPTGGYPASEINRETENVTFQFRVRSSKLDWPGAQDKWQEVFNLLQDSQASAGSPALLPGVVLMQAMHYGPVQFNDPEGRPNFTGNMRVKRLLS